MTKSKVEAVKQEIRWVSRVLPIPSPAYLPSPSRLPPSSCRYREIQDISSSGTSLRMLIPSSLSSFWVLSTSGQSRMWLGGCWWGWDGGMILMIAARRYGNLIVTIRSLSRVQWTVPSFGAARWPRLELGQSSWVWICSVSHSFGYPMNYVGSAVCDQPGSEFD